MECSDVESTRGSGDEDGAVIFHLLVVGCGEDGDDGREAAVPVVELIAIRFNLMGSNDSEHLFSSKNFFGRPETEDDGDVAHLVHGKILRLGILGFVEGISPEDICENAVFRRLTVAINLVDCFRVCDTLGDSTVDA